jgi:hypothetical protein
MAAGMLALHRFDARLAALLTCGRRKKVVAVKNMMYLEYICSCEQQTACHGENTAWCIMAPKLLQNNWSQGSVPDAFGAMLEPSC